MSLIDQLKDTSSNPALYEQKSENECLGFVKDPQWMAFVVDLFGTASQTCTLIGGQTGEFGPYLGIIGAPLYLYHSIKEMIERFSLVKAACKTAQVSEAIFWAGKGVASIGSSLGCIIKPLAGGMALAGIAHPTVALVFNWIFPIVLIVLSTIGGGTQTWDIKRTVSVLNDFETRKNRLDGTLSGMHDLLTHLQGPSAPKAEEGQSQSAEAKEKFLKETERHKLEEKSFRNSHFTSPIREKEIQEKIGSLKERFAAHADQLAAFQKVLETLLIDPTYCNDFASVRSKIDISAFDPHIQTFIRIDKTIALTDCILPAIKKQDAELFTRLSERKEELVTYRAQLYQESGEIVDTVHAEIYRKLSEQQIDLLGALITLASGILFLAFPHFSKIGTMLSLSSSILSVGSVFYNKGISKENYLTILRKLKIISKRPLAVTNFNQMAG